MDGIAIHRDGTVSGDLGREIRRRLEAGDKQIRFATARALTETAKDVRGDLYQGMRQVFDRPTPFSLNSLRVMPATKAALVAKVEFKSYSTGTIEPAHYLAPQVYGGARRAKRFEGSLRAAGLLPKNMFAIPGDNAELDPYGNMSRGQIVAILSDLRAFGEQGYRANRSLTRKRRGKRARERYFIGGFEIGDEHHIFRKEITDGHGRDLTFRGRSLETKGIYRRDAGGNLLVIAVFVRQPLYKARLHWTDIAALSARRHFPGRFREQWAKALATARFDTVSEGGMAA